jgi:hypothetical protein
MFALHMPTVVTICAVTCRPFSCSFNPLQPRFYITQPNNHTPSRIHTPMPHSSPSYSNQPPPYQDNITHALFTHYPTAGLLHKPTTIQMSLSTAPPLSTTATQSPQPITKTQDNNPADTVNNINYNTVTNDDLPPLLSRHKTSFVEPRPDLRRSASGKQFLRPRSMSPYPRNKRDETTNQDFTSMSSSEYCGTCGHALVASNLGPNGLFCAECRPN